jgi:hypothetical protein
MIFNKNQKSPGKNNLCFFGLIIGLTFCNKMEKKESIFLSPPEEASSRCLFRPLTFFLLLLALLAHGCAGRQPWSDPVAGEETARITQTFAEMQQRDSACSSTLDAKATLAWDGPGEDRTVAGFLQLLLPTSLKFVVSNPLGQPLYALVNHGQEFESINISRKQHVVGTLSGLATQYEIPAPLLGDNWGYWLLGRIQEPGASIETMRQDSTGRGVWVTLQYPSKTGLSRSHLLIQPRTRQLLARILVDQAGDTIATISYEGRRGTGEQDACAPASQITITDLPYGSKVSIDFTEILTNRVLNAANFRLKVPADYQDVRLEGEAGEGKLKAED